MRCLSIFYDCCYCFYKPNTVKKIVDNRELEKTIKYSKIENSEKYKRRAYQYTLSSIMLNNVKNEYNEVKLISNEDFFENIKSSKLTYNIIKVFEHFHITTLSLDFIQSESRAKTISNYYLLEIKKVVIDPLP